MAAANSLPFDVFSQLSGAGFGSAPSQPAVPSMGSSDLAASQTYALLAAALQQQQAQQQQQQQQQQHAQQQQQQVNQQLQQQQSQPSPHHQQAGQSAFPHLSNYIAQQAGLADALHPLLSSLDQHGSQLGQQQGQPSQQQQPSSQTAASLQSSQHADHQELLAHLQSQAAAQHSQQQAQQQQQLQQFLQQQQYAALLSSLIPNAAPQTPERQPQSFSSAYQSSLDPNGQTDASRLAALQLQLQILQQQQAAQQQQQGGQSPHQLAAAVAAAASLGRPMSPYSPILDPFSANTHPNARNLLLQQAYANAARHSLGGQAGFDLARNSPHGWRGAFSPGRGVDSDAESVSSRGSRGFADLLASAYDSDSNLSTNSPTNGKNDPKKGGKPIRIKPARSGPKNPRSAYVFYVAEQRHKLAKAADLHTKSFRDVAMMVGQQWRELSAEDRRPYEEQARLDKERYLREKRENELREGKRSLNLTPVGLSGIAGDSNPSPLSSRATISTGGAGADPHAFHRLRTPSSGSQPTARTTIHVNAAQRMASQARTLDLSSGASPAAPAADAAARPSVSTEGAVAAPSDNSNSNPSPSAVSTSTASSLSSAPTVSETADATASSAASTPMVVVPPPPREESPILGIKRKAPSDDTETAPSTAVSSADSSAPADLVADKPTAVEAVKSSEPETATSASAESDQPDSKRVRTAETEEVKNEASS